MEFNIHFWKDSFNLFPSNFVIPISKLKLSRKGDFFLTSIPHKSNIYYFNRFALRSWIFHCIYFPLRLFAFNICLRLRPLNGLSFRFSMWMRKLAFSLSSFWIRDQYINVCGGATICIVVDSSGNTFAGFFESSQWFESTSRGRGNRRCKEGQHFLVISRSIQLFTILMNRLLIHFFDSIILQWFNRQRRIQLQLQLRQ